MEKMTYLLLSPYPLGCRQIKQRNEYCFKECYLDFVVGMIVSTETKLSYYFLANHTRMQFTFQRLQHTYTVMDQCFRFDQVAYINFCHHCNGMGTEDEEFDDEDVDDDDRDQKEDEAPEYHEDDEDQTADDNEDEIADSNKKGIDEDDDTAGSGGHIICRFSRVRNHCRSRHVSRWLCTLIRRC